MATVLEVQESDARKLLQELDFGNAKSANARKLVAMLTELPDSVDEEDADLSSKSKKVFNRITEALADSRKIRIAEVNGKADDEEEEEAPRRGKKKAPAKKAAAKKKAKDEDDEEEEEEAPQKKAKKPAAKKKRGEGGGPTSKDKIFEEWVKDPVKFKKNIKKVITKFDGKIAATTIRKWTGRWSQRPMGQGYPRAAAGRESEIKKALKMLKNAD